ncbi:hypothetical protein BN341_3560 [Helicobacter heilmannii ASB1.4]|uniref:Uncharacterized protein n=1 Tax=Helicobacter heilmannii TaxID=35817 RepID=A0A0K2Y7K6_HELHE|nr:hypothetical protein BN341_3560 [Helicobacter heilmannii ASB1.4]CRI34107.1 hypothetical protein HHE01_09530 [Helicobacter heilmannii]
MSSLSLLLSKGPWAANKPLQSPDNTKALTPSFNFANVMKILYLEI